jgi:hypothetical protein
VLEREVQKNCRLFGQENAERAMPTDERLARDHALAPLIYIPNQDIAILPHLISNILRRRVRDEAAPSTPVERCFLSSLFTGSVKDGKLNPI